jgi:hypothetical protein
LQREEKPTKVEMLRKVCWLLWNNAFLESETF